MTEKQWQAQVVELAELYGWRVYHPYDSRRSAPGYPDLTLVRERVVFAELKTDSGYVSSVQRSWLEALEAAGAEAYVWRPADFDAVHERLKHPR